MIIDLNDKNMRKCVIIHTINILLVSVLVKRG